MHPGDWCKSGNASVGSGVYVGDSRSGNTLKEEYEDRKALQPQETMGELVPDQVLIQLFDSLSLLHFCRVEL